MTAPITVQRLVDKFFPATILAVIMLAPWIVAKWRRESK